MYILGINAYHGDSSACLIKDGVLVAALEEERVRRIKHWAGFPRGAIKFCLEYAGQDIRNIDYIAVSRNPLARFHKKVWRVITKRPKISFLKERLGNLGKIRGMKGNLSEAFGVKEEDIRGRLVGVEHHLAHLASAFFVSPFEKAAVVSVDGLGDFLSTMTGAGEGSRIKTLSTVGFPHSLGIFYTALTQFLGFSKYGDEYKVMGLSAFGKPSYLSEFRKIVKLKKNGLFELDTSYFLHDSQGVEMTWLDAEPKIGRIFSNKLISLLGEPRLEGEELSGRFEDIAASVQAVYEETFFHILNDLHRRTGLSDIALAGGCLQNSLANGKIFDKTPFRRVYVPPAAHDAGGAIGAAYYFYNQVLRNPRRFEMTNAFWGPGYKSEEIKRLLEGKKLKYRYLDDGDLIKKTAGLLADGKIVGWFEGRTEWGPRALGNRSILANPTLVKMKEILNSKIKKREPFRPFAPSITEDSVEDYFEISQPVPFMEKVYAIKMEKRKKIPAVVHVDGTGRLQTVNRGNNPLYYDLIKEFGRLTGVPILLNTSFNENEPIVNRPEEALGCFLRTKMDTLVLGNYMLNRSQ